MPKLFIGGENNCMQPQSATKCRRCPICNASETEVFLSRKQVPVHQNLLLSDRAAARSIARGSLDLAVCAKCGFIFNRSFDAEKLSYGDRYENTQDCSSVFKAHTDELKRYLLEDKAVRDCHIVEVGCGRGGFIKDLIADKKYANRGTGYDPCYIGADELFDGRLKFKQSFYGSNDADTHADVVICRHVIEHVDDPMKLLTAVRKALTNAPAARVFFETPCVEWILNNAVIWDFFYEHCSYFSIDSLRTAFELSGFSVDKIKHVFAGQYLWFEASISALDEPVIYNPSPVFASIERYTSLENDLINGWMEQISELKQQGSVALWGAGAKGVTFANLIDPDAYLFDCVVDLNPNKHNQFIPGSGHEIVDYRQLAQRKVTSAILMNPNYREENETLLQQSGMTVRLV